jgi:hypothetical protein
VAVGLRFFRRVKNDEKEDEDTTARCELAESSTGFPVDSERCTLRHQLLEAFESVLGLCENSHCQDFDAFETDLLTHVRCLGRLLIAYFLWNRQQSFDHEKYADAHPVGRFKIPSSRSLKCVFGELTYWRCYYSRASGGGCFPLDIALGLFADGFTPKVISLVTRLATRMSYGSAHLVCETFLGWAPAQRTINELVLNLGEHASDYMEEVPPPVRSGPSEIVVVEIDGKATPTATEEELKKRRGKRSKKKKSCGCKRHRGKACRKRRGKKKRKKKGDKAKNGRSITIVAVYTLKRGEDGKLHGPENKRVWGSYAPRKVMLDWAKAEVGRRGFHADGGDVHVLSDGEVALNQGLEARFPNASMALDIRHVEEKIWSLGRLYYKEASKELEQWVEKQRKVLYQGNTSLLLKRFAKLLREVPAKGPGTKTKRTKITAVINYIKKRTQWMNYGELQKEDLVIATGVIEGAARYVIGERMDCSGMRWIDERAEMLLRLRCIELNEEWDRFFSWTHSKIKRIQIQNSRAYRLRSKQPAPLPKAA